VEAPIINKQTLATGTVQALIVAAILGIASLFWGGAKSHINEELATQVASIAQKQQIFLSENDIHQKEIQQSLTEIKATVDNNSRKLSEMEMARNTHDGESNRRDLDITRLDQAQSRLNTLFLRMAGKCCPSALTGGMGTGRLTSNKIE
jgi:uncharacterized protein HemX